MTVAVLALLLAAPAAAKDYALPRAPAGPRVDYSAERVDVDAAKGTIHLMRRGVVSVPGWTVAGEDLWIDADRRLVTSDGPVVLKTATCAAYGESGAFDLADQTGVLFDVAARNALFYIGDGRWTRVGGAARAARERDCAAAAAPWREAR